MLERTNHVHTKAPFRPASLSQHTTMLPFRAWVGSLGSILNSFSHILHIQHRSKPNKCPFVKTPVLPLLPKPWSNAAICHSGCGSGPLTSVSIVPPWLGTDTPPCKIFLWLSSPCSFFQWLCCPPRSVFCHSFPPPLAQCPLLQSPCWLQMLSYLWNSAFIFLPLEYPFPRYPHSLLLQAPQMSLLIDTLLLALS